MPCFGCVEPVAIPDNVPGVQPITLVPARTARASVPFAALTNPKARIALTSGSDPVRDSLDSR